MAHSSSSYAGLWRWYRVNLRGTTRVFAGTIFLLVVMLATQAVVPLQVESILHHGEWSTNAVAILLTLVIVQLVSGHWGHLGAHDLTITSGTVLRERVFDRLMRGKSEGSVSLMRSSIVARHTTDVDNVAEAFEQTLAYGIPSIVRIIISMSLLTVIAPNAGLTMFIAVILFIVIRHFIGRAMLKADREALEARTRVGEVVDEAVTSAKPISGLHLIRWMEARYHKRNEKFAHAWHRQGVLSTRLITGAHSAGLAGLIVVVIIAVGMGEDEIAVVAASLLYIESVVKGLEALPVWIRSLQLALESRNRIDQLILDSEIPPPLVDLRHLRTDITLDALGVEPGSVIGIVATPEIDIDSYLSILTGSVDPADWRMSTDGHLLRLPHVNTHVQHVTAEPLTINASPMSFLRAMDADITEEQVGELLEVVGLPELVDRRFEEIGPAGNRLTVNQRQRLEVACALAAAPEVLFIGPILALADSDTALPLIASIRARGIGIVVLTARDVDVAHDVSRLIFVDSRGTQVGTHQELLVADTAYSRLWESRLLTTDVDLSVLGLGDDAGESLYAKLVTERFEPGMPLYRAGDPADRVIFVISGHVEIATRDAEGNSRRVAVLAPGMHCGDLRLTMGEQRVEDATAVDDVVVRSLSRGAISAGMSGMLDRTPEERKIVSAILRAGSVSQDQLQEILPEMQPTELRKALDLLRQDGAVRETDGILSVVQKRAVKSGAADILDRIGGLG